MSVVILPSLGRSEVSPPVALAPVAKKPRVWTIFVAWLVAALFGNVVVIGYYATLGLAIGMVMGFAGAAPSDTQALIVQLFQQPLSAVLISLLPFQLGMALVVLNAARRSPEPLRERLGLLPQKGRVIGPLTLAMAAAFSVSTALAIAIGWSVLFAPPSGNQLSAAVSDGSWLSITLISIVLSLVPAIVEEVMFRGYIQRRLLKRWSPSVAIGVSTLLFAVLHMDSLHHILAVIPLGIVTGLLAYRTNSIVPGMIVHALHNAAAIGMMTLIRVLTPQMTEESLGIFILSAIATLGLIGLPAVISLLRRMPMTGGLRLAPGFDSSLGQPAS